MRALLLLAALTAASARAGEPAAPTSPAASAPAAAPTNQDCLGCHESAKRGEADGAGRQGVVTARFGASVHKDLDCTACHAGYTAPGPHELPAPADAAEAALLARLGSGKTYDGSPRTGSPRAYLACATCHPDSVE